MSSKLRQAAIIGEEVREYQIEVDRAFVRHRETLRSGRRDSNIPEGLN